MKPILSKVSLRSAPIAEPSYKALTCAWIHILLYAHVQQALYIECTSYTHLDYYNIATTQSLCLPPVESGDKKLMSKHHTDAWGKKGVLVDTTQQDSEQRWSWWPLINLRKHFQWIVMVGVVTLPTGSKSGTKNVLITTPVRRGNTQMYLYTTYM
jgi:hypothetical protein